jgi:hypothetical protein
MWLPGASTTLLFHLQRAGAAPATIWGAEISLKATSYDPYHSTDVQQLAVPSKAARLPARGCTINCYMQPSFCGRNQ